MPHTMVIFGASGDLTSRKLIPALYTLFKRKRLPPQTRIVGNARSKFTSEAWRNELAKTTAKFAESDFDAATWKEFAQNVFYQPGDIDKPDDFQTLKKTLTDLEKGPATRVYYLSTMPSLYPVAIAQLGAAGLASEEEGERRVVIEKPFGTDLATAKQLNEVVHKNFKEHQVYRIDHYLGKETVQNMLVLRFANSIFEPLWNRQWVSHVQITAAETVGVEA